MTPTDAQRTYLSRACASLLASAVAHLQTLPAGTDVFAMADAGAASLGWQARYSAGRMVIELQATTDATPVTVAVWELAIAQPGAELLPPARGLQ